MQEVYLAECVKQFVAKFQVAMVDHDPEFASDLRQLLWEMHDVADYVLRDHRQRLHDAYNAGMQHEQRGG